MRLNINPKIHPALALGIIAAFIGTAGCYAAGSLMFPAPKPSYSDSSEIIKLNLDGAKVAAIHVKSKARPPKATLLYCHGNAEDIGELRGLFSEYAARGLDVFAIDYPGYGLSDGKPSQTGCLKAVDAAYKRLVEKEGVKPEEIIVYGRSIGSGPASYLASERKLGGLILEAGFTSTYAVVSPALALLPTDSFQNFSRMKKLQCPVLIIHGRKDEVIPFSHGENLFRAVTQPKECLWIDGAGHNDIIAVAGDKYWSAVSSFVESMNKAAAKQEGKQH